MESKAKFKLCLIMGGDNLPFEILHNLPKNEVYIIVLKEAEVDFSKLLGYEYIVISFAINPLRWWRFQWDVETDTGMDPGLIVHARIIIGPLGIVMFIDDGRW